MEKSRKELPRKRKQRDYTHAFKLQVVSEIERGELSQNGAQRKYGIQGNATVGLCCDLYQKTLQKKKINCSMTEKYDPYQNAVAERINGILKQEFISHLKIKNLKLIKAVVKDSIEIYNTKRPHFSNFYLTPQQMHLQSNIKMRTYKKQKDSILKTEY